MNSNVEGGSVSIGNSGMLNKPLLTIDQAGSALSLSPGMMRKLARTGRMKVVRIGRCVRVHPDELSRIVSGGVQ
jgi:excisionase family DNA binding protein